VLKKRRRTHELAGCRASPLKLAVQERPEEGSTQKSVNFVQPQADLDDVRSGAHHQANAQPGMNCSGRFVQIALDGFGECGVLEGTGFPGARTHEGTG
jgi:hypothetical protein